MQNTKLEEAVENAAELQSPKACRFWGSVRMTYTLLAFTAMCLHLCMRNTLNLVILCMVKAGPASEVEVELQNDTFQCGSSDPDPLAENTGDLLWTRTQQITLLGAFYYGYVVTLPLSGLLADKFGGKLLFVHSITLQAVVYMLLPLFANISYVGAVGVRVTQGLISGFGNPALYQLFTTWAHPTERTALLAFAYGGYSVGILLTFPLSSFFCHIGWQHAFYVVGSGALLFGICCQWLVYSTLEEHPRLSRDEYEYLKAAKQQKSEHSNIPWKSILTSMPVYAFILTHIFHTYGIIMFTLMLPRFLKEAMHFSISQTGIYSSALFLGAALSKIITVLTGRAIEKRSHINLTLYRRVLYVICNNITILMILAIVFSNCTQRLLVVFYSLVIGISTDVSFAGAYWPSLLFLAPSYAGLLSGIANSLATCSGFLAPIVISYIVTEGTKSQWDFAMYTMIITYAFGAVIYCLFGSSKLQDWNQNLKSNDNVTQTRL